MSFRHNRVRRLESRRRQQQPASHYLRFVREPWDVTDREAWLADPAFERRKAEIEAELRATYGEDEDD